MLNITDRPAPKDSSENKQRRGSGEEDDEEDETENVEVMVAERIGEFDEVVVWGHGGTVDEREDVYVRGVREWIGFAEAVHAEEDEEGESDGKEGGKKD